jgi:predicted membrane-bound dolichyl-phosphate-mannose-protein mannosyltransferase
MQFYNKKRFITLLVCIILLAFGIRLSRVLQVDYLHNDEITYIYIGQAWAQNGIGSFFERNDSIPPLLPALLACGEKININAEFLGKTIAVIAGVLLVLAFFLIGYELFGKTEYALISAFLAAVQPYFCRLGSVILRDGIYLIFFAIALYFAIKAIKRVDYINWINFALLAILATLTRKEGLEIFLAFIIWIVFIIIKNLVHKNSGKVYNAMAILSIVSFIYCVSLYVLQGYLTTQYYHWQVVNIAEIRKVIFRKI